MRPPRHVSPVTTFRGRRVAVARRATAVCAVLLATEETLDRIPKESLDVVFR